MGYGGYDKAYEEAQNVIQSLQAQNKLLLEAVGFYGSEDNWQPNPLFDGTNDIISEGLDLGKDCCYVGGKKAREVLKQVKELRVSRGEYFEAKLIELDREFIDLKLESSIIKRELRETQAKLKACEAERDIRQIEATGFFHESNQLRNELCALEKIAREGFEENATHKGTALADLYLKKIDELMKGDKNV